MNQPSPQPLDWWVQRVTLFALLALSAVLVGMGIKLYTPPRASPPSAIHSSAVP
ncbi:MAG: hypothetical protein ACOZIN_16645 [Myxococcota bacterium]